MRCRLLLERFVFYVARQDQRRRGHGESEYPACTVPELLSSVPVRVHRQFISSTYPVLKQHNPDLPILIREAKGTPARVFARFGEFSSLFESFTLLKARHGHPIERGVEKHVDIENLSHGDVTSKVSELLNLSK